MYLHDVIFTKFNHFSKKRTILICINLHTLNQPNLMIIEIDSSNTYLSSTSTIYIQIVSQKWSQKTVILSVIELKEIE